METEKRTFSPADSEVRATRRGRMIEGYAIVFNKRSKDLGGFTEVILPEAVDEVLERSDVLALLDHDQSRGVLARSTNGEGTLELTKDNFGVKYRYEAPDTVLGDEVLSGIRRGDIRTSSFAFSVDPVEDRKNWQKQEDGTYLRTIKKFKDIYDVSAVYREAYQDTTAAVRSLVEVRTEEETAKRIADHEEELRVKPPSDSSDVAEVVETKEEVKEEERKPSFKELSDYYSQLESKLKA